LEEGVGVDVLGEDAGVAAGALVVGATVGAGEDAGAVVDGASFFSPAASFFSPVVEAAGSPLEGGFSLSE